MATQEQLREITNLVLEALKHQRERGGNANSALGQAILYVDKILLPWARARAAGEFEVDDLVAEAGLTMLRFFPKFRGTTGGEFYDCMRTIVVRGVVRMQRLAEAKEKGCLRRAVSLEGDADTARLVDQLASPEQLPDVAAMIRENADRVHRAMRGLTVDQLRVVRLHGIERRSFEQIGAEFGHAQSWAHDVWESAASHIRSRLMRPRRPRRRPASSKP